MAKIKQTSENTLDFYCPGCKTTHQVNMTWQFNGNFEKPTLAPSILVTWAANPNASEEFKEWHKERRCHSFVKDGMIQFLGDCTHDLKDQTVELPNL